LVIISKIFDLILFKFTGGIRHVTQVTNKKDKPWTRKGPKNRK